MIIIYIILSGIIIFLSVNYLFIIYNYVKRVKVKYEFILTTNNATIITDATESGIGTIKKSVNNNNHHNNLFMTKNNVHNNNNNKLNDNINININNDNDNINKILYIKLKQAPGPIPLPILGNLTLFHKYDVPFKCFTELSKIYGNIYSLTLGSTRCVIINNLKLIREVLNKNGKYFGGRPNFLRYHKLFGGDRNNSLALCDWSQLQQKRRNLARKHCSPRYTSSYYNKMDNVGCNEIKNLIKYLNDEIQSNRNNNNNDDGIIIIHLKPLIMQSCANMFLKYMCSIRFDYYDKEFQEIVKKFDEIFWEINQGYAVDFLPWLYPFYKKHIEKLSSCAITVRKFILEKIVNEREQQQQQQQQQQQRQFLIHKQQKNHAEILQQEQNISDSHETFDKDDYDFTDALLKSLNDDPTLSKNTLIYMLEDFLGGHSAVGNLVMLVLANLIKNPNICENIQNEINEVMKHKYDQNTNNQLNDDNDSNNIMIDLNDMEKLPYTQATILETLRISSSPIVPHVATENVCISGYGINKGTIVFINNYELNTSEKYWEKPEYFMPERFLEKQIQFNCNSDQKQWLSVSLSSSSSSLAFSLTKNSSSEKNLYRVKQNIPHFFPFSVGKRTCIGQNLVKCFSFILIANILKNFNIHYVDKEQIKMYPACVALPPNTFRLKLERRNVM